MPFVKKKKKHFAVTCYIFENKTIIKGSRKRFLLKVKTRSVNFTGHFLVVQSNIFSAFGNIRSDGWQSSRDRQIQRRDHDTLMKESVRWSKVEMIM